jgi:radical SAM protein with 4Fe4S-binding SPASM domain
MQARRSNLLFKSVAKDALRLVTEGEWGFIRSGGMLQLSKETFNLRHPFGAKSGEPDALRLIGIRITDMCNLRCHTCGQWGDNGYLRGIPLKVLKQRELPVETFMAVANEVHKLGWRPIWYIWGGEPMMYPGILEFIEHLSNLGMSVTMVTNGSHVAENAAHLVKHLKILFLSLDGPNADIHDEQRPGASGSGVKSNFTEIAAALKALQAEKQRQGCRLPYVQPITTIAKYNAHCLSDIYNYAAPYSNGHLFYFAWWIDQLSAERHTADYERRFGVQPAKHLGWIGDWTAFEHEVVIDQVNKIRKTYKAEGKSYPMIWPPLETAEQVRTYYTDHNATFGYDQCVSISMTMEINANGDASLCRDYNDYVIGNIKESSVNDIWFGEKARKFRSSIATDGIMPVCRRCCGLMGQ